MRIALLFITDGRQRCAERTLEALREMVGVEAFEASVVVDDACDPVYSSWLDEVWPWTVHLPSGRSKRGFGGAIQSGWQAIEALDPGIEYVFHLEDDFILLRSPRFGDMARILGENPHVVQVALKRQPWNEVERVAGGIVEVNPDAFTQRAVEGREWFEHRAFFTTNPSMYSRALVRRGWPSGDFSEGRFTASVLADPDACFAYMGRKFDEPWVLHIGDERTGMGY